MRKLIIKSYEKKECLLAKFVARQAEQFLKNVQRKQLKQIFFAARRTDATSIKINKKLK